MRRTMTPRHFIGLALLLAGASLLPGCTPRGNPLTADPGLSSPLIFSAETRRLFREYADTSGTGEFFPVGFTTETLLDSVLLDGRRGVRVLEEFSGTDSGLTVGDTVLYAVENGRDLFIYLAGAEGFLASAAGLGSLEVTGGIAPGWYPLLLQSSEAGRSYSILRVSFRVKVVSDSLNDGDPVTFTIDLAAQGVLEGTELLELNGRLLAATRTTVTVQATLRSGLLIYPERPTLTVTYWIAPGLGIVRRASLLLSIDLSALGGPALRVPGTRRDLQFD